MKELSNKLSKLIKEDPSIINWNELCKEYYVPRPIIIDNLSRISMRVLFTYQELPETFIEKYINRESLVSIICENQKLSVRFMFKYKDILDWKTMYISQDIPEELIRKVIDKVEIDDIIIRQNVSDKFINDYKDKIDWNYVNNLYCKTANF